MCVRITTIFPEWKHSELLAWQYSGRKVSHCNCHEEKCPAKEGKRRREYMDFCPECRLKGLDKPKEEYGGQNVGRANEGYYR